MVFTSRLVAQMSNCQAAYNEKLEAYYNDWHATKSKCQRDLIHVAKT